MGSGERRWKRMTNIGHPLLYWGNAQPRMRQRRAMELEKARPTNDFSLAAMFQCVV